MTMHERHHFLNKILTSPIITAEDEEIFLPHLKEIHKLGKVNLYAPILKNSYFDPFIAPTTESLWIKMCNILDRDTIRKIDTSLSKIMPEVVVDFTKVKTLSNLLDKVEEINLHIADCSELCSSAD